MNLFNNKETIEKNNINMVSNFAQSAAESIGAKVWINKKVEKLEVKFGFLVNDILINMILMCSKLDKKEFSVEVFF